MKKHLKTFAPIILLLAMAPITLHAQGSSQGIHPLQIISDPETFAAQGRDPIEIIDVDSLPDGRVRVDVAYNGGCTKHSLELVTDGKIAYTQVKRGRHPVSGILHVRVAHDRNGDTCTALVLDTLVFNLTPLQSIAEETEIVAVHVDGSDGRVLYHFKKAKS